MRPEDVRPKLVAVDLDGTLLSTHKTISARTRAAVAGLVATGVRVVICTGRPPRNTLEIARQLELIDLGIVYNGAAIYDFTRGTALKRFDYPGTLAHETLRRVQRACPGVVCALEASYGWFVDETRYALLQRGVYPHEPDGVGDIASFIGEDVTKLLFWHREIPVETMRRSLTGLPVHGTWSGPGLLEVVGPGVTKGRALEWVAASLGFGAPFVAAFGDEDNDKEMLAWAGFGVAVANASAAIKAQADHLTCSCDDDGVAEVLEKWL